MVTLASGQPTCRSVRSSLVAGIARSRPLSHAARDGPSARTASAWARITARGSPRSSATARLPRAIRKRIPHPHMLPARAPAGCFRLTPARLGAGRSASAQGGRLAISPRAGPALCLTDDEGEEPGQPDAVSPGKERAARDHPGGSSAQASDGIPLTPSGLPCHHPTMHGPCQSDETPREGRPGWFAILPVSPRRT